MTDDASPTSAMPPWPVGAASGVGSLPGDDIALSARFVADALPDLPHLPELPERGPAAGIVGRGVGLLVEMPAQLDVRGWQLTARAGVDLRRARSLLAQDAEVAQEVFAEYTGWFKLQIVGPVTLAAELETARGHRVVADQGARRDLAQSLAEGVVEWVEGWATRLPRAHLVLQLDEPSLPAVAAGTVGTASGWGRIAPVSGDEIGRALAGVIALSRASVAGAVVHCCATEVPVDLIRSAGADGVSLDLTAVGEAADAEVAAWVEAGGWLFAGAGEHLVTPPGEPTASRATSVTSLWSRTGLTRDRLAQVVATPPCGLASATRTEAEAAYRAVVDVGHWLRDESEA